MASAMPGVSAADVQRHAHTTAKEFHMTLTVFVAAFAGLVLALAAPASPNFTLGSKTFAEGDTLPASAVANVYGCTGQNQSPELHWSGSPAGTSSFALIMRDPDAPVAGGFWHWVAFNIPQETSALAAGGSWPKGLYGR